MRPRPKFAARPHRPPKGSARGGARAHERSSPRREAESIAHELPHCPHFGPCGGCSLLDRPYPEQLAKKKDVVARALAEAGLAGIALGGVVPAPRPLHYRNRLLYPLAHDGSRVVAGFFRRGSHDLVDVRSCEIQDPAITQIANRMRTAIERLGLPIHPLPGTAVAGRGDAAGEDEAVDVEGATERGARASKRPEAALRAIAVRVAIATGDVLVGLVTTGGLFPLGGELAANAEAAARGLVTSGERPTRVVSVVRNLNDREGNAVLGARSVPLAGPGHLVERFLGMRFRVSLGSFFQPNVEAARRAIADLTAEAGLAGRVVDAYAGVGVVALAIAKRAREVIAIEAVESAARDGAANARDNRAERVRFVHGRVEDRLREAAADGAIDLLVLDPPRGGLTPDALEAVRSASPARIAYLSCGPASLARDLAALVKGSFTVERVTAYDFLPQTDHVEALAWLKRR